MFKCDFNSNSHQYSLVQQRLLTRKISLPRTFAPQDVTMHTTILTKSKSTKRILISSDNSPAKLALLNTDTSANEDNLFPNHIR